MVPEALAPGPDGTKPICELAPGDAVWSWVDGQMQPHRILYARRSKDQPVLKLRTRSRIVEAAADHLLLRVVRTSPNRHVKGGRRGEQTGATYGVEWTHLDQLRRGDLLVVLDETPDTGIVEVLPDGTDVTGDVAWLLGVILGDGTITDSHIRVCVYGETCQQVRRITAETWGASSAAEHPGYGTILHSAHLAHLLADMGMRHLGPDSVSPTPSGPGHASCSSHSLTATAMLTARPLRATRNATANAPTHRRPGTCWPRSGCCTSWRVIGSETSSGTSAASPSP